MDKNSSFERTHWLETQKANELEELLVEASQVLEDAILLEAEVKSNPAGSTAPNSLQRCTNLKHFIKRANRYFEKAQDERAETSISGRLSLQELKRRRDNADKRIKEIEDRENDPDRGKIISFTEYRNHKLAARDAARGPKGAA